MENLHIRKLTKANYNDGGDRSEFIEKHGIKIPVHTHHYESFPYTYNSIVTMDGKIIDKQSFYKESSKHKVIYNGDTTIVILEDGSKGVAKRRVSDKYNKFLGYEIANKRANIERLKKELEKLTSQ